MKACGLGKLNHRLGKAPTDDADADSHRWDGTERDQKFLVKGGGKRSKGPIWRTDCVPPEGKRNSQSD